MIGVLTLMFGFVFFDRNAMGNLAPFIAHHCTSPTARSGSVLRAVDLLGDFRLPDRHPLGCLGRRKSVLLITVVIFSVCSVLSGLAPSFGVLLASRMLMVWPKAHPAIAQSLVVLESSASRRGFNMA